MRYYSKLNDLDNRRIDFINVRPRWFRNWYCLYQTTGMLRHKHFVFDVRKLPPEADNYIGSWYGPFWSEKEADDFGKDLVETNYSYMFS